MKHNQFLATLLCVVATLAHAADQSLEETVVTATRFEQPLQQSLAHSTVITQKEIQDSQAEDVPTLLKQLAGVEIYQAGGAGSVSSVYLRGTNFNHTLVLLDGVRIGSATTGATAIDQLMLDQIERIEVVRGNASSLYGSDAIGGVIQIFTKHGKGTPSLNANASVGSYGTKRYGMGIGGEAGSNSFDVQASKFRTHAMPGIDPAIALSVNPGSDGYENQSYSANLRHSFNANHKFTVSVFDSIGSVQTEYPNAFTVPVVTDVNINKEHLGKVSLSLEDRFTDSWQSKLQRSQGVDDSQYFLNGSPSPFGAQLKSVSEQLSWQNDIRLNEHVVLNLGAEQLKQSVTSDTIYSQANRTDNSLFAGYAGLYGAQQFQLNLRRDAYSDFGNAQTFLLGYGLDLDKAWRATVSTSTGFKAPTFNDLYAPAVWGSNPNLQPERSRNNELGLHYTVEGQRLVLTRFNNYINNLIVSNGPPAYLLSNINEARIDGWELAYGAKAGDASLNVTLTQQNPRDAQTNQVLLHRAKTFSRVAISQPSGDWRMGAEWQYTGERQDSNILTFAPVTLPAYSVINLTARYPLDKRLELTIRVDNFLDQNAAMPNGYVPLGRTVFTGLIYR